MPTSAELKNSNAQENRQQADYFAQLRASADRRIRKLAAADPYIKRLAATVPPEMLAAKRWGLSNGKTPCDSSGWPIDATDSTNWRSFWHAAWLLAKNRGRWDDEGCLHFVVAPGDGITAIDLDACRSPIDGQIHADAKPIIDGFDSYAEISGSGGGSHIFLWGQKPGTATKSGRVEIFDGRNRHGESGPKPIAITGNILAGKPSQLRNCQTSLDKLYHATFPAPPPATACDCASSQKFSDTLPNDQEIVQKISQSKQAAKFLRLWDGDVSDYGGDESRADGGLCAILAQWTGGDEATIDRLFRQSGLCRQKDAEHLAKWDRDDYREPTIHGAIAICKWFYDWSAHSRQTNCSKRDTSREYHIREAHDQQITQSGTRDEMLTRTIARPYVEYRYTPCRKIKIRQTSKKDACQRRALGVACMHRECTHCRVPWIKDRLDWFEDIVAQWQDVYVTTAACDADSNAIKQQVKRRAAKERKLGTTGIDVCHINIPLDSGQVIWLTNVPTTKSEPATEDKWQQALSFALGSIRKCAHIGCTGATFKGKGPERAKLTQGLKFQPRKKRKTEDWVTDKGQLPLSKVPVERIVDVLAKRGYEPSVKDDFEFNQTSIRYRVPEGFSEEDAKRLDEEIIDGTINPFSRRCQPASERRTFMPGRLLPKRQ